MKEVAGRVLNTNRPRRGVALILFGDMNHLAQSSLLLMFLVVLAAGCTSSATDNPPPSTVTASPGVTTSSPPSAVTTTTMMVERSVRTFDVGGVEVVVMTDTDELPARATAVEVTGTLIDSGGGPKLCAGAVMTSLPPQCSGTIVDGLDMTGWAEEAQGVQWGERTVSVTWPPVDDHVQLISASEPEYTEYVYPPGVLPAECADIDAFVGSGDVNEYARGLGEVSGGVYLTNDGVIVLQVSDDPQPHRDALASGGRQACVIEVERSEAEQRVIHDQIDKQLAAMVYSGSVSSPGPGGRVEVGIPVADRATVEAIAAFVDNPSAIRVIGWAILLDG